MSSKTKNLGLFKYDTTTDGKQVFSIDKGMNENWDTIDSNTLAHRHITNCLLDVPQRIKLELNDGTLTLKAGSEIIVPNGFEEDGVTPKFDYVTTPEDVTYSAGWGAGYQCMITGYVNDDNTEVIGIGMCRSDLQFSGQIAPSATVGGTLWYDISANLLNTYRNGSWVTGENGNKALFLGIVTVGTNNVITSIDQVFNGFGYIGSTIWVDKGVKGLIPNGRNEDGTLNNNEFITERALTTTFTTSYISYIVVNNNTINVPSKNDYSYNEILNVNSFRGGNMSFDCPIITVITDSNGKIASFTPNPTLRILDYSDSSTVSGWSMPSNKYIDLTLGASGTTYTAPTNGWFQLYGNCSQYGYASITIERMGFQTHQDSKVNGSNMSLCLPVKKGDLVKVGFGNLTLTLLRFIYAEGEI